MARPRRAPPARSQEPAAMPRPASASRRGRRLRVQSPSLASARRAAAQPPPATPPLRWPAAAGDAVAPRGAGAAASASVRRIAAALWRVHPPPPPPPESGEARRRFEPNPKHLHTPDRCDYYKTVLEGRTGSKPLGNGIIHEVGPYSPSPRIEMEVATKWDRRCLNNLRGADYDFCDRYPVAADAEISALKAELMQAHNRIHELEAESRSAKKKLDHLVRNLAEEKASWRSREHDKVRNILDAVKEDLNRERKNRQRAEIMNSKLVSELSELKSAAKRYLQDYEKERKARELMEEVCDELAKEIAEDKAEVEALKSESMKMRHEVEEERKMLQMAEVWREERVQMKLVDAKLTLDSKYSQLNELQSDLEDFLSFHRGNSVDKGSVRDAERLREAICSMKFHDIKEFSYKPPPPSEDIFAVFEELRQREGTNEKEIGQCNEGETAKLEIQSKLDKEKKILSIRDRGISMTKEDLIKNLRTIAKSGTSAFVEKMQSGGDLNLIGQFGVGFYSVHLATDYVEEVSKHNNDKQYVWESKVDGSIAISKDTWSEPLGRGTEIRLHLRDEAKEYLEEDELKDLVKKYSVFINFPIHLWATKEVDVEVPADEEESSKEEESTTETTEEEQTEESEEKKPKTKTVRDTTTEWEFLNDVKAIWLRNPKEVTEEEYSKFYHSLAKGSGGDKPMAWSHFSAEGDVEFKALLFVPPKAPHDFYESYYNSNKSSLKLYVRKVFIFDEFDELLPKYLSFLKGIVDSDTLPLNVSREILQQHNSLKTIKKKLIRKALDMIRKIAEEDPDKYSNKEKTDEEKSAVEEKRGQYAKFWNEFGKSIKLGIIEDATNWRRLAKFLRFESTKSEGKLAVLQFQMQIKQEFEYMVFRLENIPGKSELLSDPFPRDNILADAENAMAAKDKAKELSRNLKSITQLYNDNVVPFNLWEVGLEMLNFANYSGDAVIFDTTYRTNKYSLICVPFVGVNHLWHNVVFGCAFLTVSYVWLFKSLLESMGGRSPKSIFTDQDEAIIQANKQVFPNTQHCFSYWHILKNAQSHLGTVNTFQAFQNRFMKCMQGSDSEMELEESWAAILHVYKLQDNNWLNDLYRFHHRWCSTFNKDTFDGGINSSQWGEVSNNIFTGIFDESTFLLRFALLLEKVVKVLQRNEFEEDFLCSQTAPVRAIKHSTVLNRLRNPLQNFWMDAQII